MRITLDDKTVRKLSDSLRKTFSLDDDRQYGDYSLALPNYSNAKLKTLADALRLMRSKVARSAQALIKKTIEIRKGKFPRASSARQMAVVLEAYIAMRAPRFHLYIQYYDHWYPFFVDRVWYTPEQTKRDYYSPPSVSIQLLYRAFGATERKVLSWAGSACRTTAPQLLSNAGLVVETPALKREAAAHRKQYKRFVNSIGTQCRVDGYGFQASYRRESGDNNASAIDSKALRVGKNRAALVVIDILNDDSSDSANQRLMCDDHVADTWTWESRKQSLRLDGGDDAPWPDEDEEEWEHEEPDADNAPDILLPLHPLLSVFDLCRHDWYTINVADVTEYKYDKTVGEKLILPRETKEIVQLLAESAGDEFRDIVAGKSGGTTVLLAGPPGVGKTLTAEVYAEAVERPLYRIQCSQLGVDPETIETELVSVFDRAARWNAITLLDESDVYIRARGGDLQANAIVGVFLRVLEYQSTVLFMTTNLPESVDDAIASRCMARIDYTIPGHDDLTKIWKVLAANAGLELQGQLIPRAVKEFPFMSGRDVKNTLKLAMARNGNKITFASIQNAARFHPNRGNWMKGEAIKWWLAHLPEEA